MKTPERSIEEIVEEYFELNLWRGRGKDFTENWLTQTLQAERQKREEVVEAERERSTKLWDILDNIDTIPDMMHPNTPEAHEKCWRYMVEATHKRHDILKTDGYNLTHPNNK